MASTLAAGAVIAALRTLLAADGVLTNMLAALPARFGVGKAIYAENGVPTDATFPYLTIGAATENPLNTMGPASALKWGSTVTVQVKALTADTNDDSAYAIINRAKALIDQATLTVSGYGTARSEFETASPIYAEVLSGTVIRHFPMIVRVYAHQAAA